MSQIARLIIGIVALVLIFRTSVVDDNVAARKQLGLRGGPRGARTALALIALITIGTVLIDLL
jgi:hypothetical protein